jgi:hypothetical protein
MLTGYGERPLGGLLAEEIAALWQWGEVSWKAGRRAGVRAEQQRSGASCRDSNTFRELELQGSRQMAPMFGSEVVEVKLVLGKRSEWQGAGLYKSAPTSAWSLRGMGEARYCVPVTGPRTAHRWL